GRGAGRAPRVRPRRRRAPVRPRPRRARGVDGGGPQARGRHLPGALRADAGVALPLVRVRPPLPGAGPMSLVAQLEVGQPVEGVYAVRQKERRLTRRGDPYLALTLADASGAIGAFVFDQPDFFAESFEAGDRVRVAGQVIARGGRPAVRVRHL